MTDPLRPLFHFTLDRGWINDPNGLIHWRGRHHLFCQAYPHAPEWGSMHWAHAASDDPVRWRALPVALSPATSLPDRSGIFSGSAVDDDGVLTLVYTIYTDPEAHPGAERETIGIATSTDGVTFTPWPGNPVVAGPPPGCGPDFRDPKVFGSPGAWSMVAGSRTGVQLLTSPDLRTWTSRGVCFAGDGRMWECPDLFPLGDDWVLLASPLEDGVLWFVGSFDGSVFTPRTSGVLDAGPSFYAAQHYRDDAGRDLVIAWMGQWGAPDPTAAAGWAGAMTVTRELFVRPDGVLGSRPVAELDALRLGPASSGSCLDIGLVVSGDFRLGVRASAAEETVVAYAGGVLSLDTRASGTVPGGVFSVAAPVETVRVLVDRSSIEVFAGTGETLTARIYPAPESTGLNLTGAVVSSSVHALGPA